MKSHMSSIALTWSLVTVSCVATVESPLNKVVLKENQNQVTLEEFVTYLNHTLAEVPDTISPKNFKLFTDTSIPVVTVININGQLKQAANKLIHDYIGILSLRMNERFTLASKNTSVAQACEIAAETLGIHFESHKEKAVFRLAPSNLVCVVHDLDIPQIENTFGSGLKYGLIRNDERAMLLPKKSKLLFIGTPAEQKALRRKILEKNVSGQRKDVDDINIENGDVESYQTPQWVRDYKKFLSTKRTEELLDSLFFYDLGDNPPENPRKARDKNSLILQKLKDRRDDTGNVLRNHMDDKRVIYTGGSGQNLTVGRFCKMLLERQR